MCARAIRLSDPDAGFEQPEQTRNNNNNNDNNDNNNDNNGDVYSALTTNQHCALYNSYVQNNNH